MLLAFVMGGVQQNTAPDDAMLGDRLNRALLQASDRSLRIVAVVEVAPIPGVAERIVLRSALWEHRHYIIGVLQSSGERFGSSADIETLIHGESMYWLRADRMSRVALRPRYRHPQHENAALLDGPDPA